WQSFTRTWNDGSLVEAFRDSNSALLAGLAIGVPGGIVLGMLAGYFRIIDRILAPYVNMMLVVPMVALVPILIIVFGLGTSSRVAVIVLFVLPDVLVNTRGGVRLADRQLLMMARSYGSSSVRKTLLLPTAFPSVMTGLRIGIGRGITGMIVVELTLVASGMGGFIMEALGRFRAGHMIVMILLIGLEAVVLTSLCVLAERRVLKRMGA
ncbi:MAG TPA: ABC transporter permease subunit, partial [Acidimicrobiales bacterium]|nr:ABC transporter permease subunit [Acidimicrobiales bacterium]